MFGYLVMVIFDKWDSVPPLFGGAVGPLASFCTGPLQAPPRMLYLKVR